MSYSEWCKLNNCTHAHCPCECEHPQPFVLDNKRLICGVCFFLYNSICEMIPCDPKKCQE